MQKTKNKWYVPKIMFLCAVARPRQDTTNSVPFDGRLGIWPFIEFVLAKRTSWNRPAGTMEMKEVNVNGNVWHLTCCFECAGQIS